MPPLMAAYFAQIARVEAVHVEPVAPVAPPQRARGGRWACLRSWWGR